MRNDRKAMWAGLLLGTGVSLFASSNPDVNPMGRQAITQPADRPTNNIERRVRHELLMLPYFTIFDNLSFRVDGDTVTLLGEVTRPVLSQDAARVVQKVEGVGRVENKIEVLPPSGFDNQIRWATARAVYGFPMLNRYGLGAQPSIHIVVKNGNVTLTGVVDNVSDKSVAGIRANGVANVFSVVNELRVVSPTT